MTSANSYENILNRYKTKKDLLAKTRLFSNKENEDSSPSSKGPDGYLSFLEKQLERANRAYHESA
jgi:hypothetical protein